MPDSIEDFIPREADNPIVQNNLDKFSLGLDYTVDFGAQIVLWDIDTLKGEDEQLPPVIMFRHFLQLIDSISILVRKSSVDPCKLILRGVLETFLGIEYLFQANTTDRCMAFLVCDIHRRINDCNKSNPTSQAGKQFKSTLGKDKLLNRLAFLNFPNQEKRKEKLEEVLKSKNYQKAEKSYQELRDNGINNPNWFQLFNGPKNIESLANYLNFNALYDILYRKWSGKAHGFDIILGKIRSAQKGKLEIIQIRDVAEAQQTVSLSLSFSLIIFELYILNRIAEKHSNYINWRKIIDEFNFKVSSREQLIKVE